MDGLILSVCTCVDNLSDLGLCMSILCAERGIMQEFLYL